MLLDISKLDFNCDTQVRVEVVEETVEDYAYKMEKGVEFTPIDVFHDGLIYIPVDGFHRILAAQRLGRQKIEATIIKGTKRAAWLYARKHANAKNGMRLTNADKRKKVNDYCQDYECMFWTDAKIAIEADVSLPFVTRIRGGNKPEKIIVERNGKTFERRGKNKAKLENVVEAPIEKDDPRDDVIKHLAEENEKLKDQMIIGAIDDTGEQQTASELIEELRKENQILSNQLNTVKISRDTLMNENAQLKKQVAVLQRKLKSLES